MKDNKHEKNMKDENCRKYRKNGKKSKSQI